MGITPTIDMCISGREITEPRPSPVSQTVMFLSRVSGEPTEFVEVGVDGVGEVVRPVDVPPASGRGGNGGVWCWYSGDGAVVYIGTDGSLRLWPDRNAPLTTELASPGGAVESPVAIADRDAVIVTSDRGSVWMVSVTEGRVERLDNGSHDFCADPAVTCGDDGNAVLWQAWSVPHMPWDHSLQVRIDLVEGTYRIIEGTGQQQQITPTDRGVFALRDDTGWLNLWCDDQVVVSEKVEHGGPSWGASQRSFAISPDGRHLAFTRNIGGFGELCVLSLDVDEVVVIGRGVHHQVHWGNEGISALRSGARTPHQLVMYQLNTGASSVDAQSWRRTVLATGPVDAWSAVELSEPTLEVADEDGANVPFRRYAAGQGRCLVHLHGGPTDQWQVEFMPRVAYWQSQGWDVIIPDPRGSTGHGRSHMQALQGGWGRHDVDDVATVIEECHRRKWSTPLSTVVMGSSSGGMATLGVLIDYPEFTAGGVALYPVSDAAALSGATHRFEAHYNHSLIGPDGDPRYAERSMVGRAAAIRRPILLMHGIDDPVVPVEQSRVMRQTLESNGVPVDYVEFAGEGHGFRQPENRQREYELVGAFLSRIAPQ